PGEEPANRRGGRLVSGQSSKGGPEEDSVGICQLCRLDIGYNSPDGYHNAGDGSGNAVTLSGGRMRFTVLGSGSTGNAVLISSETTNVLVDAGLSAREILRRMSEVGVDPAELDAVVITHEHSD